MTLAYDIGRTLPFPRSEAEARMTQTWRIGTLVEITDPTTYEVTQVLEAVYDGPARFKFVQATSVSEPDVGGQVIAQQTAELHLPSGTVGVAVDMRAVCDACPEDASLVGRVLRIKGLPAAGQTTAQRWPVEESGEVIAVGS